MIQFDHAVPAIGLSPSAWLGIRGRRAGSVAELAGTRAVRLGTGCDLRYHGRADCNPRRRGARSAAAQEGEQFRGRDAHAAWGCADACRLQGRYADAGWPESRHLARTGARDRILVDHCDRGAPATDDGARGAGWSRLAPSQSPYAWRCITPIVVSQARLRAGGRSELESARILLAML
jgi:hypothetical protein